MTKKLWFAYILPIVVSFIAFPIINAQAAENSSTISFSPYVDQVRDTYGRPLKKNTNYILKIYNPDTSQRDSYYVYDGYEGSAYDWLWLTNKSSSPFSVQINNQSEVLTDGKQKYILNGRNNNGEVVRWEHDSSYIHGGLYWGNTGHTDRYGFRRVAGDRDYKYLLISNYGSILANFSSRSITTLAQDSIFLVSFERE